MNRQRRRGPEGRSRRSVWPWILGAVFVLLLVAASAADAFLFAMLAFLVTGLGHLALGRSWVSGLSPTPGRRTAAVPLLLSVLAFMLFTASLESPATLANEPSGPATANPSPSPAPSPVGSPQPPPSPTAPEPPGASASPAPEGASENTSPAPLPSAEEANGQLAVGLLAELDIKGRAPRTGYARDQFGQRWADVDRNGCDQRNDVLDRDLTDKTYRSGTRDCVVLTGTLLDPYTGRTIDFVRGERTSNAVQIDHVVALSDAWQKGAQQLSEEMRTLIGNDTLNLLAVDGPTNQRKGDGDAATWLPPNRAFRCEYVARQVAVKHTYGLWVTPAEHDAIARVLEDCPGELSPAREMPPLRGGSSGR